MKTIPLGANKSSNYLIAGKVIVRSISYGATAAARVREDYVKKNFHGARVQWGVLATNDHVWWRPLMERQNCTREVYKIVHASNDIASHHFKCFLGNTKRGANK